MNSWLEAIAPYLVWFGIPLAFVALVIWVYRPGARRRYQQDATIPFREDKPDKPRHANPRAPRTEAGKRA